MVAKEAALALRWPELVLGEERDELRPRARPVSNRGRVGGREDGPMRAQEGDRRVVTSPEVVLVCERAAGTLGFMSRGRRAVLPD